MRLYRNRIKAQQKRKIFMAGFSVGGILKSYRSLFVYSILSNILFSSLGLTLPWMLGLAIDYIFPQGDYQFFVILASAMLLIYLIRNSMRYIAGYIGTYTMMRILVDIRSRIFKHLQSLSLRFYDDYRAGKLISNVISDVGQVQQLIGTFIMIADQVFTLLVAGFSVFFISWKLALVLLAFTPLSMLNFQFFRKRMRTTSMEMQEKISEITANLSENIHGIKVVKAFGKEYSENLKFFSTLRPTIDIGLRLNLTGNICSGISDTLGLLTNLTIILLGVYFHQHGELTIGEFVTFYSYTGSIVGPISNFAMYTSAIAQGSAGVKRITNLLSVIPEIKDQPNAVKAKDIKGVIEFEDVSFRYGDVPVIEHLTLQIPAGNKIALVGPSGCGKSTISNLLLRFYDVTSGRLLIDDRDIRSYTQQSYHSKVGVVLQEPFLFSGSILDNIAYARKEATREEIMEAARMANVAEFAEKLPNGYNTTLGENGTSLSGGQKQRIAIARAILKNPSILILDEATSALDTVSEKLVQEALDNLMEGRTTVIIAHRLSTIRNADTILVLSKGKVIQQGSHDELMAVDGTYKDLYTAQQESGSDRVYYTKPDKELRNV